MAQAPDNRARHGFGRADSPFRRGPLRNLGDVELIATDYAGWYNQQRLMH